MKRTDRTQTDRTQTDQTRSDQPQADKTRTVAIPERTALAISERISGTEFESVDAYVSVALDQLLVHVHRQETDDADTGGKSRERREPSDDEGTDDAVEDRLESLGYL